MKEYLTKTKTNQRGSAGVKFTLALLLLFLVAHAGYNYIPVAYQGASLKEEMHTAVLQGSVLPTGGDPVGVTRNRILRYAESNNLPQDAIIEVKKINGGVQATASYSKKVNILPFGLYVYDYQFNHSAAPGGFLTKQ